MRVRVFQGILDAVKTTNFHIVPSLQVHRAWYNCVFEIEALRLSCAARQVGRKRKKPARSARFVEYYYGVVCREHRSFF